MFVETSKCFPESETEFKCLMVFFPLLPEVMKGQTLRGASGVMWRKRPELEVTPLWLGG